MNLGMRGLGFQFLVREEQLHSRRDCYGYPDVLQLNVRLDKGQIGIINLYSIMIEVFVESRDFLTQPLMFP